MELKDWLSIFIPASVTIIGLVVNYFATKNNIKQEISKQQSSIKLDKLLLCLEDYQDTYRSIMTSSKLPEKERDKVINKQVMAFQKVMDYVFLYGSKEACEITAAWQQYNYASSGNPEKSMIPVCYANLLSSQICLDVTGNCNKPSYYYKMRLTDFNQVKDSIKKTHNQLVKELKLDNKLLF